MTLIGSCWQKTYNKFWYEEVWIDPLQSFKFFYVGFTPYKAVPPPASRELQRGETEGTIKKDA